MRVCPYKWPVPLAATRSAVFGLCGGVGPCSRVLVSRLCCRPFPSEAVGCACSSLGSRIDQQAGGRAGQISLAGRGEGRSSKGLDRRGEQEAQHTPQHTIDYEKAIDPSSTTTTHLEFYKPCRCSTQQHHRCDVQSLDHLPLRLWHDEAWPLRSLDLSPHPSSHPQPSTTARTHKRATWVVRRSHST